MHEGLLYTGKSGTFLNACFTRSTGMMHLNFILFGILLKEFSSFVGFKLTYELQ